MKREKRRGQAPEEAEGKPVVAEAGLGEVYRTGGEGKGVTDDMPVKDDVEARLDRLFETLWTSIKATSQDVKPIPFHEAEKIDGILREIHETAPDSPRVTRKFCSVFLSPSYGRIVAPYLVERWGPVVRDEFRKWDVLPPNPTRTLIEKIQFAPPPKIKRVEGKGISYGTTVDYRRGPVISLGVLGDPAAVPFLIQLLDDQHIREWAVRGLGLIGDARAIPFLRRLLGELDKPLRGVRKRTKEYATQAIKSIFDKLRRARPE